MICVQPEKGIAWVLDVISWVGRLPHVLDTKTSRSPPVFWSVAPRLSGLDPRGTDCLQCHGAFLQLGSAENYCDMIGAPRNWSIAGPKRNNDQCCHAKLVPHFFFVAMVLKGPVCLFETSRKGFTGSSFFNSSGAKNSTCRTFQCWHSDRSWLKSPSRGFKNTSTLAPYWSRVPWCLWPSWPMAHSPGASKRWTKIAT